MHIKSFRFRDHVVGWKTETITFDSFNLLVGPSGVGKTRLIDALLSLSAIAKGANFAGVEWDVVFELNGQLGRWLGAFGNSEETFEFKIVKKEDLQKYPILHERLEYNDKAIVDRSSEQILVAGERVPVKLSSYESCLSLLNEDENLMPVSKGFSGELHVLNFDRSFHVLQEKERLNLFNTENLFDNNINLLKRIFLASSKGSPEIKSIKESMTAFFPVIEDVKVELHKFGEKLDYTIIVVFFKERGVDHWIEHFQLSSGMWKTFLLIANHYLCASNSVILVDEIENSLGVNCIEVLGDLMNSERGLQYIITSHHPYIINNVPISHWKIVTRNQGLVQTHPASEFGIGASRHDAFMQLMQLDAFKYGTVNP